MGSWGFLTNHALVLIHVFEYPSSTLREIASAVGVTERATLTLLRAMEEEKIISRRKVGRRNHYRVDITALLEYQAQHNYNVAQIGEALSALGGGRLVQERSDSEVSRAPPS